MRDVNTVESIKLICPSSGDSLAGVKPPKSQVSLHADKPDQDQPGRALPSYMKVIGFGPGIYPVSIRSMRKPAASIIEAIGRLR